MKKRIFFIIIAFILIIGILVFTDYFRFKNNKSPLFCVNNATYNYKDGHVNTCIGFGYKVVSYNRVSINKKEFMPIWSKIKNPNLNSNYILVDETEMCATALEKIYEEGIYVYYLPCIQSEAIFLKYEDGTKISVKDALDNHIVTIDDLISKGLNVHKEYKED